MCGICGMLVTDPLRASVAHGDDVERMVEALRHRGPDSAGSYVDGPVALGSARLAILDLSSAADQPMLGRDGDAVIVFNGEIYNYVELREELEREGARFSTQGDTEVLLELYLRRGPACLDLLRGMFAFAIWDRRRGSLFLARDRMGEKPLVYAHRNGVFVFASEIRALLALPWFPREIDPVGLHYGLHYVAVPAPYSAFRYVQKMRPAEYLTVSRDGISRGIYWKPHYRDFDRIEDAGEAAEAIDATLAHTVRIMNRSDVPLGVMLSGGVDSSAVTAALAAQRGDLDTFCISYSEDGSPGEFAPAAAVARHCGTRHHEISFHREHLAGLPEVVRSYGEPLTSFVPLHAQVLSAFIKRHATVALTGNGGDELYGGYPEHHQLQRWDRSLRLWRRVRDCGLGAAVRLCPLRGLRASYRKYARLQDVPKSRWAADMRLVHARAFCDAVYSDAMRSECAAADPSELYVEAFETYGAPTLFDGVLFQQLVLGSQHSMVDIPDIAGMAHALEYRAPFLDVKMVELGMRIAPDLKVKSRLGEAGGKWILRRTMLRRLPRDIVWMKKAGFGSAIPYAKWFVGEWREVVREKLAGGALEKTGLFRTDRLLAMYDRACRGERAPLELLWGVVTVAQWVEEFFGA